MLRPARAADAYDRIVLDHPRSVLALLLVLLAFFAYHAKDFRFDASADSLLLEDDADLQLFRQVGARYQTRDLLIVTFSARGDVFSDQALGHLTELRDELRALPSVHSVVSILDAPLVNSSDVPLLEMKGNVQTLESPNIDRERAREELGTSPIYRDLILSPDHRTTAILVYLERDEEFAALQGARNELLIQKQSRELDAGEVERLAEISAAYTAARGVLDESHHATIESVRAVIEASRQHGAIHLGGVPMISDDMVTFVKGDLVVFGSSVLVFLVLVLTLIFRRARWVVLPLGSCFYASVVMIGMLGWVGWGVTVISANFLALMLIITISMNIHLAVRYIQLSKARPGKTQRELVSRTIRRMARPCLYTALTTIIGFSSLVFSGIKPVQDFGWMMSIGLAVAFLTSFSLFPAILVMLKKSDGARVARQEVRLTEGLANLTERHGTAILVSAALMAVVSSVGISRLTVENSFIDYFREQTEIYRGMKLIDDKLGGTTPLEVLLHFDTNGSAVDEAEEALEEDDFEDWDLDEPDDPMYWFTEYKVERIKQVHDYLDGLPAVGKVLSLASGVRVAEGLNEGKPLEGFELALLFRKMPDEIKGPLIDPYVSIPHEEARIELRIRDSKEGLRRREFLERIRTDLREQLEFSDSEVTVTGTLLLYNNMLQSLVSSQIWSLGAAMLGIGLMFLILFRSVSLAVIGLVPNLLAAGIVLGLMGLAGVPLDVMTVTIAAITIGISVDNGIHYIYRFREEFSSSGDYLETLHTCHANIGMAVFYTSTTVIFGFSILMLSNFLPTIYFGVLTGLAMGIAFVAALTLLPSLILAWRPFGEGSEPNGADAEAS